jgi:hypothetical protein
MGMGQEVDRYRALMAAREGEREEDAARRLAFRDALDRCESIQAIRERVVKANEHLKRLVPSPEERVALIRGRLWSWASFLAAEVVYGHLAEDLDRFRRLRSRYDE